MNTISTIVKSLFVINKKQRMVICNLNIILDTSIEDKE